MLEKFTDFAETVPDSAPLRLFKLIIVVSHAGNLRLPRRERTAAVDERRTGPLVAGPGYPTVPAFRQTARANPPHAPYISQSGLVDSTH